MGRRRKTGLGGHRILGILLALGGAFILVDLLPLYVWWLVLAVGLIVVGWLLFNS